MVFLFLGEVSGYTWGRNLSSVDIAKCEPQVFRLEKTLKIGKNIKNAVVLVWGRQILENSS